MASLYRRANPAQARVLRIVEGAVKNASDAHPELKISPQHRRSIAKRAAGTLTAQWPDVLAARGSSDSREPEGTSGRGQSAHSAKPSGRGGCQVRTASPLRRLEQMLCRPLSAMKAAGETERVAAYVEVLRMISELRKPTP